MSRTKSPPTPPPRITMKMSLQPTKDEDADGDTTMKDEDSTSEHGEEEATQEAPSKRCQRHVEISFRQGGRKITKVRVAEA